MSKIVLISGKARAGKDTFAKFFKDIVENDNKRALIIKYGDILKFFCKTYLGWNGKKDLEGRTLLQNVGTEIVRKNNEDTWINCVKELVKGFRSEYDYILIPDTRFPNEIKGWYDSGFDFVTVRVNRVNEDFTEFDNELTDSQKTHASEISLDYWVFDHVVLNKNIGDLTNAAKEIYEEMERF